MAMHLAGWYQSVDPAGSATQIDALVDERIYTTGKNIRVPQLNQIVGLGAQVTTAAGAPGTIQIYAPSINFLGNTYLKEYVTGTVTPTSGVTVGFNDHFRAPITLGYDELMRAIVTTNPAAAGPQVIGVLLSDGQMTQVPQGRRIVMRGTYASGGSNGVWQSKEITWETELPPGNYGVIGLKVLAATTYMARLNFRTQEQWRPGVMVSNQVYTMVPRYAQAGASGVWGIYTYTQPPTLEIVQSAAAAGTVYMDIVQLSGQAV